MSRTLKFAKGGRADRMRDRRMADIEKDYKIALAKGKSEKEANAKREQRVADAKDDYAKRTGADRTETRAAEKAAESRLSAARRSPSDAGRLADKSTRPVSVTSGDSLAVKADIPTKVDTPKVGSSSGDYDSMTFGAAFRQAMKDKGKGNTFSWKGKSYKLDTAGGKTTSSGAGKPKFDMRALRALEAEVTRPNRARTATSKSATKPAKKASVDALGERKLPPPPRATLYGVQAVAERRRLAERAKDPPTSKRAAAAAELRSLSGAKFAKGGKVDGCAVRGKTKGMRKKQYG